MILYGKKPADGVKETLRDIATQLSVVPKLTIFVVGDNKASLSYVKGKEKDFAECNFCCETVRLPETITQEELVSMVKAEGENKKTDGIIVQLPLPNHIDPDVIAKYIPVWKDVDGFRVDSAFNPCTPSGVLYLLKDYGIEIDGKHCVIIGRSNIVGRPLARMMLDEDATVTVCHSRTVNLKEICKTADILVSAVGKPRFVTKDMVKPGAVVVDVGINRGEDGKLCGDVCFDEVEPISYGTTPVPGGIGLMTRVMLLTNTLFAASHRIEQHGGECNGVS